MKTWKVVATVATMFTAAASGAHAQVSMWRIDPVHSEMTFRIRHFITPVRGAFVKWEGMITADPEDLSTGSVKVAVETKSIDTNDERRDTHLKSNDFFATDSFPSLTFASTKVELTGTKLTLWGDLTIRGTTKPVVLAGEFLGTTKGMDGKERIGFDLSTKVNRLDYGVSWNRAAEGGGAVLSDDVTITISVEAIKQ